MSRLTKVSRFSTQRMLAELRSQLPITEYLSMLHSLAVTGQLPCYDPPPLHDPNAPPRRNGQFTPPDRELQHKTLTFLVDKAFAPIERPAAAALARISEQADEHATLTCHAEARNLTVGDLIRRLTAPAPAPASQEPQPADAQIPEPAAAPELHPV